jgi:hypothetical protein
MSGRNQASQFLRRVSPVLVLAALSVFLQIRWSPPNHRVQLDGTVFAYAGQRILQGDVPYKEFWDHKPPGVYYLNALAFLFAPSDDWTIWYLTVAWTVLIAIAYYALLSRILSRSAAVAVTVVLLATVLQPKLYEGPNLTEFYGVLPAIASLLSTYLFVKGGDNRFAIVVGAAFAASALLKQTGIGTALVCIFVVLVYQSRTSGFRAGLRTLAAVSLPVAVALFVMLLYWSTQGALVQLWQSVVEYNLLYVGRRWEPLALYGVLREVSTDPSLSPLLVVALAAAIAYVITRRQALARWLGGGRNANSAIVADLLYLTVFLSLLVELVLIGLAGGSYGHYYMTLPAVLCTALSYWFMSTDREGSGGDRPNHGARYGYPVALAGLAVWLIGTLGLVRPTTNHLKSFLEDAPTRTPQVTGIGNYVMRVTEPSDSVLVWGPGAELNFETRRRSPTPYVYYLPLFMEGFHNGRTWNQFLGDLRAHPPRLIIVPREFRDTPSFSAAQGDLSGICGCQGDTLSGFTELSEFVAANYHREPVFEDEFLVFHLDDT